MDKSIEKKIDEVLKQIEEGYRKKKPIDKIKEIRGKTNIKCRKYLTLKDLILACPEKKEAENNGQKDTPEEIEKGRAALKHLMEYFKRPGQ